MVRVCIECEHSFQNNEDIWECGWFNEILDEHECDNCPLREVVDI